MNSTDSLENSSNKSSHSSLAASLFEGNPRSRLNSVNSSDSSLFDLVTYVLNSYLEEEEEGPVRRSRQLTLSKMQNEIRDISWSLGLLAMGQREDIGIAAKELHKIGYRLFKFQSDTSSYIPTELKEVLDTLILNFKNLEKQLEEELFQKFDRVEILAVGAERLIIDEIYRAFELFEVSNTKIIDMLFKKNSEQSGSLKLQSRDVEGYFINMFLELVRGITVIAQIINETQMFHFKICHERFLDDLRDALLERVRFFNQKCFEWKISISQMTDLIDLVESQMKIFRVNYGLRLMRLKFDLLHFHEIETMTELS